ncbi:Bug family tripartite tricarboxylate transporter substrate binding protein [Aquabacter spiritensis]|uniref:Tripartite-type tricarboxylate transporter receptor subunit TctC n=1 Tax=Aquabacter spiritensis TaxID=933073 RepID=A0A4R3M4K8_9HYPH|nr:tripartite tricarboxylate transporter substrate binding protein [Aquabacter spiritensis]TCT06115.1 tripartite-type tricarboxylate transporter receptor subunit TctC [Aquabacter spiritensis]
MFVSRRFVLRGGAAALAVSTFAGPASAQAGFPAKAIEIIVPFATGGSTDLGARIVADALQQRWNVPVKVVNRPGGNTLPGVEEVMRAPPDGYTVLMDGPGSSSMLETVVKNLPFKVMDRSFIGLAAQTPLMLVVPEESPWKTLEDAVRAAKADPAHFSWTSGAGTTDLTFRRLFQIAGVNFRQTRAVQVKGGSEAINLVAGGHVNIGVGFWGSIAALAQAKRLRVLAVAGPERFPAAPEVPTTAQAGMPDLIILQWIGVSGPAGMNPEVVGAWNAALQAVSKDPKVVEGLARVGLVPFSSSPEGMRAFVTKESRIVEDLWRA